MYRNLKHLASMRTVRVSLAFALLLSGMLAAFVMGSTHSRAWAEPDSDPPSLGTQGLALNGQKLSALDILTGANQGVYEADTAAIPVWVVPGTLAPIQDSWMGGGQPLTPENVDKLIPYPGYSFQYAYFIDNGIKRSLDYYYKKGDNYFIGFKDEPNVSVYTKDVPQVYLQYIEGVKVVPIQLSNTSQDVSYQGVSEISIKNGENNFYFEVKSPKPLMTEPEVTSVGGAISNAVVERVEDKSTPTEYIIRYNASFNTTEPRDISGVSVSLPTKEVSPAVSLNSKFIESASLHNWVPEGQSLYYTENNGKVFKVSNPTPVQDGKSSFDLTITATSPLYQKSSYNIQLGSLLINDYPVAIPFFTDMKSQQANLSKNMGNPINGSYGPPYYFSNPNAYPSPVTGFFTSTVEKFINNKEESTKTSTFNVPGVNNGLTVKVSIVQINPWPGTGPNSRGTWGDTNNFGLSYFIKYKVEISGITQDVDVNGSISSGSQEVGYIYYPQALAQSVKGYRTEDASSSQPPYIWADSKFTINDSGKLFAKFLPWSKNLGTNVMKLSYTIPNGYDYAAPVMDYNFTQGKYGEFSPELQEIDASSGNHDWLQDESTLAVYAVNDASLGLPTAKGYLVNWAVPSMSKNSFTVKPQWGGGQRLQQQGTTWHMGVFPTPHTYRVEIDRNEIAAYPRQLVEDTQYDVEYRNIINVPTEIPLAVGKSFKYWRFTVPSNRPGVNLMDTFVYPGQQIDISDQTKFRLSNEFGVGAPTSYAFYATGFKLEPVFTDSIEENESYRIFYAVEDPAAAASGASDTPTPAASFAADTLRNSGIAFASVPANSLAGLTILDSPEPVEFMGVPGYNVIIYNDAPALLKSLQYQGKTYKFDRVIYDNPLPKPDSADAKLPAIVLVYKQPEPPVTITFESPESSPGLSEPFTAKVEVERGHSMTQDGKTIPDYPLNEGWEITGWTKKGDPTGSVLTPDQVLTTPNTTDVTYIPVITHKIAKGSVEASKTWNWVGKIDMPQNFVLKLYRSTDTTQFEEVPGAELKSIAAQAQDQFGAHTQTNAVAWENVALNDTTGKNYSFRVEEGYVDDAQQFVKAVPDHFTQSRESDLKLLNSYQVPTKTFTLTKSFQGAKTPVSFTITAPSLPEDGLKVTLSQDNNWAYTTELPAVVPTTGETYTPKVVEEVPEGYKQGEQKLTTTDTAIEIAVDNIQTLKLSFVSNPNLPEAPSLSGEFTLDYNTSLETAQPEAQIPVPAQEQGYRFDGYQMVGESSSKIYTADEIKALKLTQNTSFYPVYTPLYKVSFKTADNDPGVDAALNVSTQVLKGSTLQASKFQIPAVQIKAGYRFAGWVLEGGDGSVLSSDTILTTPVTSDTTYIAKVVDAISYLDIVAHKTWVGDVQALRPEAYVRLLSAVGDADFTPASGVEPLKIDVTKASSDLTWNHMPTNTADGTQIRYSVEEGTMVDGAFVAGSIRNYNTVIQGMNITNTFVPPTTAVQVRKEWVGYAADSVTVRLMVDGAEFGTAVLNAQNNWTASFDKVPLINAQTGKDTVITVTEDAISGYDSKASGNVKDGFILTNTFINPTHGISVSKHWVGKTGPEVTVKLLADGNEVAHVALNAENGWTQSFGEFPEFNEETGKPISYSVEELAVEGYTTEITGSVEHGFVVTNTQIIKNFKVSFESPEDASGLTTPVNQENLIPEGKTLRDQEVNIPVVNLQPGYKLVGWHKKGTPETSVLTPEEILSTPVTEDVTYVPVIEKLPVHVEISFKNPPDNVGVDGSIDVSYEIPQGSSLIDNNKLIPNVVPSPGFQVIGWEKVGEPGKVYTPSELSNLPQHESATFIPVLKKVPGVPAPVDPAPKPEPKPESESTPVTQEPVQEVLAKTGDTPLAALALGGIVLSAGALLVLRTRRVS